MTKVKAVIKPVSEGDVMLPGIYHTKEGKTRFLVNDFDYEEISNNDKDFAIKTAKSITKTLTKKQNPTIEYEWEVDESGRGSGNKDKKIDQVCNTFWAEHPQIVKNGDASLNPNFAVHAYDILFLQDEKKINHKKFKSSLDVVNRVVNMSAADKRNVAYFFGQSPVGLDEQEMDLLLVDFTTGICLRPENKEKFANTWMGETSAERDYVVNTHKAIAMGLFKNLPKEGRDNYYYGQEFVGTQFNDVLAYCKRESRVYEEYVVKEIKLKDAEAAAKPEKKKNWNNFKTKEEGAIQPAISAIVSEQKA